MTSSASWVTRRVNPRDLPEVLRRNGFKVEQRATPDAVAALHPNSIALRFGDAFDLSSIANPATPIDVVFIQHEIYEHALVSRGSKIPNWQTMEYVRRALWGVDSVVFQIHGRGIDYGQEPGHCLHLWRPLWPFEDAERRAVGTAERVMGKRIFLPHLMVPRKKQLAK